jgi:hypothetical protein
MQAVRGIPPRERQATVAGSVLLTAAVIGAGLT